VRQNSVFPTNQSDSFHQKAGKTSFAFTKLCTQKSIHI
jgi:hypothetical protein